MMFDSITRLLNKLNRRTYYAVTDINIYNLAIRTNKKYGRDK